MTTTAVVDASSRYGEFYVPRFEISAAGAGLGPAVLRDVNELITWHDAFSRWADVHKGYAVWKPDSRRRESTVAWNQDKDVGASKTHSDRLCVLRFAPDTSARGVPPWTLP